LILDEAQAVKNPAAKQSQAARRITAQWRAVLTGTPVENRLRDLWSLFSVTSPGYLGTLGDFEDEFAGPIEEQRDPEATARLQALVRPFLLRRLKSDPEVSPDLPPKIETRETCTLTREQATLYQAQVDRMMEELKDADEEVSQAGREGRAALVRARFQRNGLVLQTLLRLKQVCDHPALMLGDESSIHGRSGKLERLVELLDEVKNSGEKALVFTQFASFAQRLQPYLSERLGMEVLFLHGGTPRLRREELIRRFQDPGSRAHVFLLSLKAGGVGLNLTAANHVIHFDRWWNPAVEDQATDRAHRIGQRKTVEVRTMVTAGTLEETIDQVLQEKRDLAKSVIGSGEQWLAELSTAKLRDLVRLRNAMVEE
ncbi:MAG: DEAD/DEAH box helicase, partial [Nitrososphaerota archaeon]|nr:DEAD/DEAH box helicase [Nitrososphaerota archaeon]